MSLACDVRQPARRAHPRPPSVQENACIATVGARRQRIAAAFFRRGRHSLGVVALTLAWALGLPAAAQAQLSSVVVLSAGSDLAIALSPDGQRLAMDLQGVIWTLPSTGGSALRLTEFSGQARRPQWSPDGAWLMYQSLRDGRWDLWRVPVAGGPPQRLTDGPFNDRDAQFLPDGSTVVFSSDRAGSYDLWSLSLPAGTPVRMTFRAGSHETQPAVSPDGRYIAYISQDGIGYQLRLRTAAGEQDSLLLESRQALAAPSWRPDGGLLTVVRHTPTGTEQALVLPWPQPMAVPTTWGEDVFESPAAWLDLRHLYYAADGGIRRRQVGSRDSQPVYFFAGVPAQYAPPESGQVSAP